MDGTPQPDARTRLLQAALRLVRMKGWAATSVDDLCLAAGITKGSFFHHFKTKEALGAAAAAHWGTATAAMFATAPYHGHADPADRVLAYIDFRAALLGEDLATCTCFAGTLVQETWAVDNGFLTPTLKIKRNMVEGAYGSRFHEWVERREAVLWHE